MGRKWAYAQRTVLESPVFQGTLTLPDTVIFRGERIEDYFDSTQGLLREIPYFLNETTISADYNSTYGWPTNTIGAFNADGSIATVGWRAMDRRWPGETYNTGWAAFSSADIIGKEWSSFYHFDEDTGELVDANDPAYVQLMFPEPVALHSFSIRNGLNSQSRNSGLPRNWSIQASNDGVNWTTIADFEKADWELSTQMIPFFFRLPGNVAKHLVWRFTIYRITGYTALNRAAVSSTLPAYPPVADIGQLRFFESAINFTTLNNTVNQNTETLDTLTSRVAALENP